MATGLVRGWWVFALRGIAALMVAVLLLTGTTMWVSHAVAVGLYMLSDGLFAVVGTLCPGRRSYECRVGPRLFLMGGMLGLVLGAFCVLFFVRGARVDLLLAGWMIAEGICALGMGHELAQAVSGSPLLDDLKQVTRGCLQSRPGSSELLAGRFAVTMGVLVMAWTIIPAAQPALAVVLLALFAVAWGYLQLCTGLSLGVVHWGATSDAMEAAG